METHKEQKRKNVGEEKTTPSTRHDEAICFPKQHSTSLSATSVQDVVRFMNVLIIRFTDEQ